MSFLQGAKKDDVDNDGRTGLSRPARRFIVPDKIGIHYLRVAQAEPR